MLVLDLKFIGNRIYEIRNKKLMSRMVVAEKADLSDRAYADIERGNVNMRIETFLKICNALNTTPNDIVITEQKSDYSEKELLNTINNCTESEKRTALNLLKIYLDSLNK